MKHNPGFLALVTAARAHVSESSVGDVKARLDRGEAFHLIDIREDNEWSAGRARGARHLGRGILERDIETQIPDRDADIVLYCAGGFRSVLAAESLQKLGYRHVVSMEGGFRAWTAAGFPVES
jgi:rhodanese-related sulfurtransferase